MLPARSRFDPDGYYHRLGVDTAAARADIVAAYRLKARLLHPDVPVTGNAEAFVAVKQAYDVLSDQRRRAAYDLAARQTATGPTRPEVVASGPKRPAAAAATVGARLVHRPRLSDFPLAVWVGMGGFLCLCLYEVAVHLLAASPAVRTEIRPNAATVAPLPPSAHQAVLYGPAPVRLAGTPNFYIMPAGSPAVLWRLDTEHNKLVPLGQLPPFSSVQAVRLIRTNGMLEVLINDRGSNGFIAANHAAPGNAAAARRAYCSYNAGPTPLDGELLARRGSGHGALSVENRAVQPAVVKLRDNTGAVVLAVFLAPGGTAALQGLAEGSFRPEFAIGELWSRACNSFAAGMRAQRMEQAIRLPGDAVLVVAPDSADAAASSEIADQVFDHD